MLAGVAKVNAGHTAVIDIATTNVLAKRFIDNSSISIGHHRRRDPRPWRQPAALGIYTTQKRKPGDETFVAVGLLQRCRFFGSLSASRIYERTLAAMMLITVRDDLVELNRALTEAESTRDRAIRAELLQQALIVSTRAMEDLRRESDLAATLDVASGVAAPYERAIQQTWDDAMLFQAFLEAERRLFRDLGLDASTTDRLLAEMSGIHTEGGWGPPDLARLETRLEALEQQLSEALEQVRKADDHKKIFGLLRRSFLVVGGGFVVGANALVGAATAPVTGGLSVAGAAVSASVGGIMIDCGFPD